jgi:hypothetical protein
MTFFVEKQETKMSCACRPAPAHSAAPTRRSPPHPAAAAAPAAIDQLAAAVCCVNMNAPVVGHFDLASCYPHIHTEMHTLTDGHQTIIGVYLVPTSTSAATMPKSLLMGCVLSLACRSRGCLPICSLAPSQSLIHSNLILLQSWLPCKRLPTRKHSHTTTSTASCHLGRSIPYFLLVCRIQSSLMFCNPVTNACTRATVKETLQQPQRLSTDAADCARQVQGAGKGPCGHGTRQNSSNPTDLASSTTTSSSYFFFCCSSGSTSRSRSASSSTSHGRSASCTASHSCSARSTASRGCSASGSASRGRSASSSASCGRSASGSASRGYSARSTTAIAQHMAQQAAAAQYAA